MILLNSKNRLITLLIVLVSGIIIFTLGLGTTGLVDETPPLFAAAARSMSESGDWITPKVNGIFRFDKPPLIYWLMGFFYSLPKNEIWDSLDNISEASISFGIIIFNDDDCRHFVSLALIRNRHLLLQ